MEDIPPSETARNQSLGGLQNPPSPTAIALAEHLAAIFAGTAHAILHYGSRAQGRVSRADSPFDFFVIVTCYGDAYRAAASVLGPRCRPGLAVLLARLLPPNAMSIRQRGPFGEHEAKCLIISLPDFERECSARARDHFVQARITQTVQLVWARGTTSADAALAAVREARARSFDWAQVFLPPSFDLAAFCRTLIHVSFAHEIRAEAAGHADVLFAAQRELLLATYGPILAASAASGTLGREGEGYRQLLPPGRWKRWLVRNYFRWSEVRTTLRLLKHPLLYDDWLEYLIRKVRRSAGQTIVLTAREQRYPLIFLWPRVLRYLRSRPHRGH